MGRKRSEVTECVAKIMGDVVCDRRGAQAAIYWLREASQRHSVDGDTRKIPHWVRKPWLFGENQKRFEGGGFTPKMKGVLVWKGKRAPPDHSLPSRCQMSEGCLNENTTREIDKKNSPSDASHSHTKALLRLSPEWVEFHWFRGCGCHCAMLPRQAGLPGCQGDNSDSL